MLKIGKFRQSLIICVILLFPSLAAATILTKDTVWQGEVTLSEKLLVPSGISLTIRQGTVINVVPSDSTKTDPEYLSPLTEITVRGKLKAEGTTASPVVFRIANADRTASWAGIIVDGGTAELHACKITNADTALYVIGGTALADHCEIKQNRYGISAVGAKSSTSLVSSSVTDNDYGVFLFRGAQLSQKDSVIRDNRKKDFYTAALPQEFRQSAYKEPADLPVSKVYDDAVLKGDTVWQGRILVNGIIRVPEGARLIIMPGTLIEFSKKDTNGDGIGENGFMIQGVILAKGTPKSPIIFRSAEKERREADWDAINIMNSDGAQNLIEYCQIEDAYHALHLHFSNIAVTNSVIRHNYRGIQFQESVVMIRGNQIYENRSGIQGRNSTVTMSANVIGNNYMGGNFFRSNLQIRRNQFLANIREGLRLREGATVMEENLVDGNRYGLMVADTFAGRFSRNVITNNTEVGFLVKNADNIDFSSNFVSSNGFNGINVQDARAEIRGNQITENGERGIGILSFTGIITGNNFMDNKLYAIDYEGKSDIDATGNWWDGVDPDKVIFDGKDDSARGRVLSTNPLTAPVSYAWPLAGVTASTIWSGEMVIDHKVEVPVGTTLTIKPSTRVAFAEGIGMTVSGKLIAKGDKSRKITFTSLNKKEPGAWEQLAIEHAGDSVISHAVFEYAEWALHCHFTNLSLFDCQFRYNKGGMRFRSGPVVIKNCLFSDNEIGLRSYMGNVTIEGSDFTRNEIGIFVREKGSGLKITGSNLFANTDYNIRVGDFNDEDVDARGNWWGSASPADTIFDGRNEPGIGNVIYEPFLQKRVTDTFTGN